MYADANFFIQGISRQIIPWSYFHQQPPKEYSQCCYLHNLKLMKSCFSSSCLIWSSNYIFKVKNENIRKTPEICSKLYHNDMKLYLSDVYIITLDIFILACSVLIVDFYTGKYQLESHLVWENALWKSP